MGKEIYLFCTGNTLFVLVFCEEINKIFMGFSTSTGTLVVLTTVIVREEDNEAWLYAAVWVHNFFKKKVLISQISFVLIVHDYGFFKTHELSLVFEVFVFPRGRHCLGQLFLFFFIFN